MNKILYEASYIGNPKSFLNYIVSVIESIAVSYTHLTLPTKLEV